MSVTHLGIYGHVLSLHECQTLISTVIPSTTSETVVVFVAF